MNLISSIILTLVIGLVVLVVAYAIIMKVYEENRKNAKTASEELGKVFNQVSDSLIDMIKKFTNDEEAKKKELDKDLEKMFQDEMKK